MGGSSLEALNFDVFIGLVTYLDVSDILALSKCSKLLRAFALTHQTWVELGRRLVLKGIPLPTKGFKTPDDLSPEELVESVVKAARIYRGWTSRNIRATGMTLINEDDCRITQSAQAITRILPITSDIVVMLLGHVSLILWDVVRGNKLAEFYVELQERSLLPSIFSYGIDLANKTFYFLTHNNATMGDRKIYQIKLMKVDFEQIDSDLTGEERADCFEEVISFREFATHLRFGFRIEPRGGFILDVQERRLCQVYIGKKVLLFVVLDWNERKAAFINTGLVPVASLSPGSRFVTFIKVYVCTWDAQNERLILTVDTGRGTLHQYIYHASQFLPFMTSIDVLTPETYDIDTIPLLSPIQYYPISYGADVSQNSLSSPAVHETAFQTPWNTFSGAKAPSPCSRPFLARLNPEIPDDEPAPLRGNVYVDFPPSPPYAAISHLEAVFSFARDGPTRYPISQSKVYCVRYGALAWTKEGDSTGRDPIISVRIARFSYSSSENRQLPQDGIQVCTPLLMNGDPVEIDTDDQNGLVSLSLDEVHGRLFLVYQTGRIIALHYG